MKKVLVGTDTTASADIAVQAAAEIARVAGAELLVVHVRSNGASHDAADPRKAADPDRYLTDMSRRFPNVDVRTRAENGAAADRLVEIAEAERVDTIVLGNRGTHGSWWRVRDSVPNIVLRHAPCSVFIVDTRRAQ
ncbi:MAG TPA: universal stress protein [Actinomycetota bacterium]|jgi:nucleotide-binding universal stress UspA family protein|nr:universal stress protein [Actinomycetota bacterium]